MLFNMVPIKYERGEIKLFDLQQEGRDLKFINCCPDLIFNKIYSINCFESNEEERKASFQEKEEGKKLISSSDGKDQDAESGTGTSSQMYTVNHFLLLSIFTLI